MDQFDAAEELEQRDRDRALVIRKPVPEFTGLCLNCGAPVAGRYCNTGCRIDHENDEKMRRINGQ